MTFNIETILEIVAIVAFITFIIWNIVEIICSYKYYKKCENTQEEYYEKIIETFKSKGE